MLAPSTRLHAVRGRVLGGQEGGHGRAVGAREGPAAQAVHRAVARRSPPRPWRLQLPERRPLLRRVEARRAAGAAGWEVAPIKHGRSPIKPGRSPIKHGRSPTQHGRSDHSSAIIQLVENGANLLRGHHPMAHPGLLVGMARPCAARSAALARYGTPRAGPASPPEPAFNMTVFARSTTRHPVHTLPTP